MAVKESSIINKLAGYFESVDGMKTAYPFASNPDSLSPADLPATLFVPRSISMNQTGHHNLWTNVFDIVAATFVAPMQSSGGKLKYLENQAISLMPSVRVKFQEHAVINDLLSLGLVRAHIQEMNYGAGTPLLTHNGIAYIGFVTTFDFKEKR